MRVVDQEPMETLHLYVVPENQLPPKRDYPALFLIIFSCLFIIAIIAISVLVPEPNNDVSFSLAVKGFALSPISKTVKVTAIATGKQYVPATTATGTITFYNGAIYPQIIPVNTILNGADGISVITDAQVTIPPAEQTIPPTYGQISVPAHSTSVGAVGNIRAGDINEACCVTSVIAQNSSFHGGRDAYIYIYLSDQDVKNTTSPLLPTLQSETLSLLPRPQLHPTCTAATTSTPSAGKETTSAVLRITETCSAFSYSLQSVKDAIRIYSRHFGTGTLTHVQFVIVGITDTKGVVIPLFVTGQWKPTYMRHYYTGK